MRLLVGMFLTSHVVQSVAAYIFKCNREFSMLFVLFTRSAAELLFGVTGIRRTQFTRL